MEDLSYNEYGLPEYLQDSIKAYKDNKEYYTLGLLLL